MIVSSYSYRKYDSWILIAVGNVLCEKPRTIAGKAHTHHTD